jgi:pimeloyl-ACP methyl ester carboxylesterase
LSYINLRGHQIWSVQYKPRFKILNKTNEKVLLLHGGLSSTEDWDYTILPAIKRTHHVYGYDRSAHGRTKVREGYYHFEFQRDEAIAYLEDVVKEPAHLIGWSDGGIIALYIAIARPDLVKSIIVIGANYHHDCGASHDPETIEIKDEDLKEFIERTGQEPKLLEEIVRKAYQVWASEPTLTFDDLAKIQSPTLILAGDDEPFTSEHTFSLYEAIENARLAIVPGTSHFVVKEKPELVQAIIKDFYKNLDFPMTKWPNRRKERTEGMRGSQQEFFPDIP